MERLVWYIMAWFDTIRLYDAFVDRQVGKSLVRSFKSLVAPEARHLGR